MFFMKRFKALREKRGYKKKDIAKLIEVSEVAIGKYESGQTMPTVENLIKLRKIFNVSLDYLLGLDILDAEELINNYNSSLICENIKKYRLKAGDTQKEFAFKTDMKVREVEQIEEGIAPSLETVLKMASMLDIDVNELIGDAKGKILDREQDKIVTFALNLDNRDYIKLAIEIKNQGLKPDEVVFGKKIL